MASAMAGSTRPETGSGLNASAPERAGRESPAARPGETPAPAASARVVTLDILRGFALLGMILAHVHKSMGVATTTLAANPIGWFITMFVAEKDRTIFAFLFGVSFAIMLRRLELRGLSVTVVFLRRLAALYVIGFAVESMTQFVILREYALWGVPLLFLRKFPTRTLLWCALLSASAFSIREVVDAGYGAVTMGWQNVVARDNARQEKWEAERRALAEATATRPYAEVVALRARAMIHDLPRFNTLTPSLNMTLFILGLLAIRHRIFDHPEKHLRTIGIFMVAGAACWIVGWTILAAVPHDLFSPRLALQLRKGFGVVDEQQLAFTFMGAVTLLLARWSRWKSYLSAFAWVGRMALTNYLMQAALIDFASEPYGLGWHLTPREELFYGLTLFGVQVALGRLWLARFRYGPVEWAWRSITYWKWQPLRVGAAEAE